MATSTEKFENCHNWKLSYESGNPESQGQWRPLMLFLKTNEFYKYADKGMIMYFQDQTYACFKMKPNEILILNVIKTNMKLIIGSI